MVQDEVIDLVMLNIAKKFKTAEKEGLKRRLKALALVDQATFQLCTVCNYVLDETILGHQLRQEIFNEIPKTELQQSVATIQNETSPHAPNYYNLLKDSYRSLRIYLPALLKTVKFEGVAASEEVLAAWKFLYELDFGRPRPNLQDAPLGIITKSAWRAVIFDNNKQLDRRYYTFCVLQKLISTLQRRDIFIAPSHRWQDQRTQLLQGNAWQKVRSQVSLALGKTTNGEIEVKKLAKHLDSLYRQVAKRFGENESVSLKRENDYERISLAKRVEQIPLNAYG